jgi:dihydrofolate reductase
MTPPPAIVTCRTSISLDGFTAGPNQGPDAPFGEGGMRLPEWQFETDREGHQADAAVLAEASAGIGAYIMGRHMFGPGRGPWDLAWRGWWGEDPPYHTPVLVLSHHARAPLPLRGGTTFTFVTEGIEAALAQARAAAGGRKVALAGGAATIRQYLRAGLVDELYLHLVPVTLGAGERLFEDVGRLTLAPVEVVASPTVTHLKYAVVR